MRRLALEEFETDFEADEAKLDPQAGASDGASPEASSLISGEGDVSEGPSALSLLREVAETILLTLVIFIVINTLTSRFRIEGPSMNPTLHEGQYLIINKLVYKLHPPERGDIIVFHHPRNAERDLIKRVVGLPGEEIQVREGHVYVDDVLLEEPYLVYSGGRSARYTLGADEFYVLGDNRPNSDDSRSWGALERDQIVGKVWVSYWPPSDWGGVAHHQFSESVQSGMAFGK